MMGKSHALSGAVGWLGGAAALTAAGHPPRPRSVAVGAVVSAGFALVPDIDHTGSTIARTLGPISRAVARGVSGAAAGFGQATCDHCADRPDRGGHRLVTHTVPFALGVGGVVALAGHLFGVTASVVVVGLAVWLATPTGLRTSTRAEIVDALIPGQVHGRRPRRFAAAIGSVIAAAAVALLVRWLTGSGGSWCRLGHAGPLDRRLADPLGKPTALAGPGAWLQLADRRHAALDALARRRPGRAVVGRPGDGAGRPRRGLPAAAPGARRVLRWLRQDGSVTTRFSDDQMRTLLPTTRPYTAVILKAGPNRHMDGVEGIVWEHGRRNFGLRADGQLSIVCPVDDGTDVTGIGIFDLGVAETAAIMDGDPGVRAGVFTYELHACRSFPGDALPAD